MFQTFSDFKVLKRLNMCYNIFERDSRISNMAFPCAMKVMKHDTLSNIMLERPGVLWKPLLDEEKAKNFWPFWKMSFASMSSLASA